MGFTGDLSAVLDYAQSEEELESFWTYVVENGTPGLTEAEIHELVNLRWADDENRILTLLEKAAADPQETGHVWAAAYRARAGLRSLSEV